MNFTQTEVIALMEGLMTAEHRKLKKQFPRCRLQKEFTDRGIVLRAGNGRRKCEVVIGNKIELSCWRSERYGVDDYLSSWSYSDYDAEEVLELARHIQTIYFPLLEQPDKTSMDLFPALWD